MPETRSKRSLESWAREMDEAILEADRVHIWRRHHFEELGFSRVQAELLAVTEHHRGYVEDMLRKGWTHDQVINALA